MKNELKAIALKYNPFSQNAPVITAKGQGYVADKIIQIAKEHCVYIREDQDLAELLYRVNLGEEIPEEFYPVIAEILVMVLGMRDEAGIGFDG